MSSNFTDRLYLFTLFLASVGLLLRPGRVSNWMSWLLVNCICLIVLGLLVRNRQHSPTWEFVHDWYPVVMFVVCFEEVSHLSFLLRNAWQDHHLLKFEAWLFPVPPTVWLGHMFAASDRVDGTWLFFLLRVVSDRGRSAVSEKRQAPFSPTHGCDSTQVSDLLHGFRPVSTEGPAYTLATQHNFQLPKWRAFRLGSVTDPSKCRSARQRFFPARMWRSSRGTDPRVAPHSEAGILANASGHLAVLGGGV